MNPIVAPSAGAADFHLVVQVGSSAGDALELLGERGPYVTEFYIFWIILNYAISDILNEICLVPKEGFKSENDRSISGMFPFPTFTATLSLNLTFLLTPPLLPVLLLDPTLRSSSPSS